MHQLAALTLTNDIGEPVGRGHEARDFAAGRSQWRRRIQLRIGDRIERIGRLGKRAHDAACHH